SDVPQTRDTPPSYESGVGRSALGGYANEPPDLSRGIGPPQPNPLAGPQMGDGGGMDPRVEPGDEEAAYTLLQQWLVEERGVPAEELGNMPVKQILDEVAFNAPPDRQDLRDAAGVLSSTMGASSVEDPSMGPDMQYTPDNPR